MKKVCVITGGGSGMGLATAKVMGKDYYIIICGRTVAKLEGALQELKDLGIEAESMAVDVSDKESVEELAKRACEIGEIKAVIHAAGMSPNMGSAEKIMSVNALGTVHMNDVFYQYMKKGSCIIDVSSMSAYMLPGFLLPKKKYKWSRISYEKFFAKMMKHVNLFPQKMRAQIAYGISKNFVVWFARTDAARFGQKGIRVLSVSPGSFETPMGEAEKDGIQDYIQHCAIKRLGHVEEIAYLFLYLADEKLGYLTGTDILCDGGLIAANINPLKKSKSV